MTTIATATLLTGCWTGECGLQSTLAAAHPLVHLNAALNALATVLLLVGLWRIKHGREQAHGRAMLGALGVSSAFLASYLTYHAIAGSVRFTHTGVARGVYLSILASHVVLAAVVPFLALTAVYFGTAALAWGPWRGLAPEDRQRFRVKHIKLVRWAFPIWLYVSVTGVVVYAMLYHLWPSADI